ncbi:unnamed protein product, partial [marine sediment metagenome]
RKRRLASLDDDPLEVRVGNIYIYECLRLTARVGDAGHDHENIV